MFLALALGYMFKEIAERAPQRMPLVYSFTGACALLFAAFYPVLSGARVAN